MDEIKVLVSKDKIDGKVHELALEIKKKYFEKVFCVVVLTGAMVFFSDLMRELRKQGVIVRFGCIKLSSYEQDESTGNMRIELDIKADIHGEDVLIIEDIVDTGYTLHFIKEYIKLKGAKSVKACTLLDKKERRKIPVHAEFVGFEIPNRFVIGYGLDYGEKFRDLDFVGYIQ